MNLLQPFRLHVRSVTEIVNNFYDYNCALSVAHLQGDSPYSNEIGIGDEIRQVVHRLIDKLSTLNLTHLRE